MGTSFFKSKGGGPNFHPSEMNMTARAVGANTYGARSAGTAAQKDIGAAQGLYKAGGLKPTTKDAASAAHGPKV